MMKIQVKTGVVAVASPVESGGQRAEELIDSIAASIGMHGVEVVKAEKVVWNIADAIAVCKQMKAEGVDSLVMIDVTWVMDSLKYIFVNELKLPILFWAVPYTETFSIGCIQHFGSILTAQGIPYDYVYGLGNDKTAVEKTVKFAKACSIIKKVNKMRIALLGPRQTWRVAGPQDMTNEEWEFSRTFGVTLVHVEMDEVTEMADAISDQEAEKTWKVLEKRTGRSLLTDEAMLYMVKVYMAVKAMIARYDLDAVAAECYPQFGGLMNITSSWLADEGIIVDTEGDISHTMVMYILNLCAGGGATALGEVGSYEGDIMQVAHEGSTAHSLAENLNKVQLSPSGEKGCFVGLPLKPMEQVTVASMAGSAGSYKLLVASGSTKAATEEEWVDGGSKLLVKLSLNAPADQVIQTLMANGMDHHLLIKEGDHTELLQIICKHMKINAVAVK